MSFQLKVVSFVYKVQCAVYVRQLNWRHAPISCCTLQKHSFSKLSEQHYTSFCITSHVFSISHSWFVRWIFLLLSSKINTCNIHVLCWFRCITIYCLWLLCTNSFEMYMCMIFSLFIVLLKKTCLIFIIVAGFSFSIGDQWFLPPVSGSVAGNYIQCTPQRIAVVND